MISHAHGGTVRGRHQRAVRPVKRERRTNAHHTHERPPGRPRDRSRIGIGRAIATRLAEDGFPVVVLDLDGQAADTVAGELSARG